MLGVELEEVPVRADAGVGYDDVEPPEALDRGRRQRLDLRRVTDITVLRQRAVDAEVTAASRAERQPGAG